jgi:hypothetical protein
MNTTTESIGYPLLDADAICPRCGASEQFTHHPLCQARDGTPTSLSDAEVRENLNQSEARFHETLPLMAIGADVDCDDRIELMVVAVKDPSFRVPLVNVEVHSRLDALSRHLVRRVLQNIIDNLDECFIRYDAALRKYDEAPARITEVFEKLPLDGKRELLRYTNELARDHAASVDFDDDRIAF